MGLQVIAVLAVIPLTRSMAGTTPFQKFALTAVPLGPMSPIAFPNFVENVILIVCCAMDHCQLTVCLTLWRCVPLFIIE